MRPSPPASDKAQEVELPVKRHDFRSRDCDEEEEEKFFTPPSTLDRSSVTKCNERLRSDPATESTMPQQMAVKDAHQETQGTEMEAVQEQEPSSPTIRSLVERQNEMQLKIQQHRSQLDDLQRSHKNLTREVSTIPEEATVKGTQTEALNEPEQPSSAIRSLVERQDKMKIEIQQQRRQLDYLQRSYDDLARGSSEGAQGLQAEELAAESNLAFRLPLTESHIHRISRDLVNSWKTLSHELGLSQADIDQIDADFRGIQEKTYQALLCWRRKETSNATVGRLVTALENLGRGDVIKILKEVVSNDVTIPVSTAPPVSEPITAATREEQEEGREPDNGFDANHAQDLEGKLELLHGVLQKLTQTDAQHQFISEIQKLLEVQESYEKQLREIIASRSRYSDDIMEELKANQTVRIQQSQQIGKLLCTMKNVPVEKCKMCKLCKSCKEKRRNTHDGSGKRHKLSVKQRKTKSLYSSKDEADSAENLE